MQWMLYVNHRRLTAVAYFRLRGDAMMACNAFNDSLRARAKWSRRFCYRYRKCGMQPIKE